MESAATTCRFFDIDAKSTLVCPLSTDYIAGKMMYVRSQLSGAKILFEAPSMNPLNDCREPKIDLVAIVPSQIDGLMASCVNLDIINTIVGGAPLSPKNEASLLNAPFRSFVTYGMTETCSHVALREVGSDIYKSLGSNSFAIDERGCLIILNPHMSFQRVVTNDVVELIDSSRFRLKGRIDNVIISGALKLHPELIEQSISDIMGDKPFYIGSRESPKWGREAVMYVEADEDDIDTYALLKRIHAILPPRMSPKAVIAVPNFRRTSNGKIIRYNFLQR